MPKTKSSPRPKSKKAIDVLRLIELLKKYYPDARCALHFNNPEQLLIATILSAQCTDERVNLVTKTLFKKYPNLKSLAQAPIKQLENDVRPTGFYKNKARHLQQMAKDVLEKHGGEIPRDIDALTQLPGVGRKTANVVLGNSFGIASGVVVDTHVRRLSLRLGLTQKSHPEQIELDLNKKIPHDYWIIFSHWLIFHGRAVCKARRPQCDRCFLSEECPSYKNDSLFLRKS